MDIRKLKLLPLDECNKHIRRMLYAYYKMMQFMPLDSLKYSHLSDAKVENIDQFIFRFSKLQDAMEERLFKSVLIFLEEEIKNKPFLDVLNRLEQLKILKDKEEWLFLRKLRNELSHEYANDSKTNALNLNMVYENTQKLYEIFMRVKMYINDNMFSLTATDEFMLETPLMKNASHSTRNRSH